MKQLKAIDFFCGTGGMSYGLLSAGIRVLAGIDNDAGCRETYEANVRGAAFIRRDIIRLTAPELERLLSLPKNDPDLIFAGCSPCQYWSKIRTDKTKSEKSAFLLRNFERFIEYFRPAHVVVENVPGLLTRKSESILPGFLDFLKRQGYAFDDGIINARHYGVPQNRRRYLLIASRLVSNVKLPSGVEGISLTVKSVLGEQNGFRKVSAGHKDNSEFLHTVSALSEVNLRRVRMTPRSGGSRLSWKDNSDLQVNAYAGRDEIFRDVYARMHWDRPSPTITTRFISFSNGRFGHPEEDRAISLREGATLQSFPKTFVFKGKNINHIARQIGNAVPPELARRIGIHLSKIGKTANVSQRGQLTELPHAENKK